MTLRSSDLQSGSDLDSIRNSCDVFSKEPFAHFEGMMYEGFAHSLQMSKQLSHMLVTQCERAHPEGSEYLSDHQCFDIYKKSVIECGSLILKIVAVKLFVTLA